MEAVLSSMRMKLGAQRGRGDDRAARNDSDGASGESAPLRIVSAAPFASRALRI